jgi:hypothetical protein
MGYLWALMLLPHVGDQEAPEPPIFRLFPALYAGQQITLGMTQLYGPQRFLQLPFVGTQHALSRQQRRANERAGKKLPEVRTVVLRRQEPKRREVNAAGDTEWSCQWLVQGHWRRQYYPSENVHKPKWIEEYLKGDPTKPLKVGSKQLFHVKR